MGLEIEATYENGVLKPDKPLPLDEHARVTVTVQSRTGKVGESADIRHSAGMIPWTGDASALAYLLGPDNLP